MEVRTCPECEGEAHKGAEHWICVQCGHHILPIYRVGVDIGQTGDPAALAAVEWLVDHFEIRLLGRIPLGTSYPELARRIVAAAGRLRAKGGTVTVYMDATGVGAPIVDMVREPLREIARLRPVLIGSGDELREMAKRQHYLHAGKEFMVSRLTALLQTGKVIGPVGDPEFEALAAEMTKFKGIAKPTYDAYGAKSGAHDDLILALALSVLEDIPTSIDGLDKANESLPRGEDDIPELGGIETLGWSW